MEISGFSNLSVVKLLREVAAAYEVRGEDRFRIRAYDNAATSVEHASEEVRDIWEDGRLKDLAGIGSAIADYLDEFFRTGRVKHFEEVKKTLPAAMFELLGIPEIGAKTAYALAKNLHLKAKTARQDLLEAARQGEVRKIPGFGEVSEQKIIENLEKNRKAEERMSLPVAAQLAQKITDYIRANPSVIRLDVLGSLRRGSATVGDIDIAVATTKPKEIVEHFIRYPEAVEVLNEGDIKGRIILKNGRQIDLMTQSPESYGALLQHFTGSKNHNIHLREIAKSKGLSLSEYGMKGKNGKIREFANEEDFYEALAMMYIPPELREDSGEIELALERNLPDLIEYCHIRGDLQTHTVWSDGQNTVEEMVNAAQKRGYEYIGITDHQLSLETVGISAVKKELIQRKSIIEQINSSYRNIRVLNGVEVLIRADGRLSYPREILKEFDYVLGAVHTGFSQDKKVLTQRIVNALRDPYIKILAHPTTRLIGSREGIDVDWEEIFKVCAGENKILEIDAFPDRLDLPDLLVKEAKGYGIKFSIDSDAHAVEHLDVIKYGVTVARRGWLSKGDVINTLPLKSLKKVFGIE